MTTILADIKTFLGVDDNNLGFDSELLLFINSSKAQLAQIGLNDFVSINIDANTEWPEFDNSTITSMVKHYVLLRTKLSFDPIPSETISRNVEEAAEILEGRIGHELDEVNDVT